MSNVQRLKNQIRRNEIGIQMIPTYLRNILFGDKIKISQNNGTKPNQNLLLEDVKDHLRKHQLWKPKPKKSTKNPEEKITYEDGPKHEIPNQESVHFRVPPLMGNNVEEHFFHIGEKYSKSYSEIINESISNLVPEMPSSWAYSSGWTKYFADGSSQSVEYPDDDFFVLDVEVCMQDRGARLPTLAVALGKNHWYSWCSDRLLKTSFVDELRKQIGGDQEEHEAPNAKEFIPIGHIPNKPRLMIGHHVSFDRSFLKEQYILKLDGLRFLDTMSLHIAVSGLTGYQRALYLSYQSALRQGLNEEEIRSKFSKAGHPDPKNWVQNASLNSLKDIFAHYCKKTLDKEQRDLFKTGQLHEIRSQFQDSMLYCAKDVLATREVFEKLWPLYLRGCPHPVTLAGMLEMSVMYLPVKVQHWNRYLFQAQSTYDDIEREMQSSLKAVANEACKLQVNDRYKKDPWLWDLDWDKKDIRFYKKKVQTSEISIDKEDKNLDFNQAIKSKKIVFTVLPFDLGENDKTILNKMMATERSLCKSQSYLAGYPKWYREFCQDPFLVLKQGKIEDIQAWEPGPNLISTQLRSVSKLLRLTWNGNLLHYDAKEGWGYLVPPKESELTQALQNANDFPLQKYFNLMNKIEGVSTNEANDFEALHDLGSHLRDGEENKFSFQRKKQSGIPMFGCTFFRLPHKDGPNNRVGCPLSKDFLRHMENGLLQSYGNQSATQVLKLSKMSSYWKMNHKRIYGQLIALPHVGDSKFGALLPRVVVAGTVTRRAVEPTWLTASNAYADRAGSELKSIIQAPTGFKFVGADVDSQELWIASLLGDSNFAKIHGCTALGWMTLQGSKNDGTDMHTVIANLVGITRNESKVLNYGRIYGAGIEFAARFLCQSNPKLTQKEGKQKAVRIYEQTKGQRKLLKPKKINLEEGQVILASDENDSDLNFPNEKTFIVRRKKEWDGGSESHMFNCLEEIALLPKPRTPVLNCMISSSLLNEEVRTMFLTSIVNWVVQSSAVDYLHLLLVSMRFFIDQFDLDARFSISIHDEVRYLARNDHQHQVAFALQMSNMLTRAMFASRLEMYDLPMSVAFFSSVDIDDVLRKEVDMDCKTPSNPHGLYMGYGIPTGQSYDIYQLINMPDIKNLTEFKEKNTEAIKV